MHGGRTRAGDVEPSMAAAHQWVVEHHVVRRVTAEGDAAPRACAVGHHRGAVVASARVAGPAAVPRRRRAHRPPASAARAGCATSRHRATAMASHRVHRGVPTGTPDGGVRAEGGEADGGCTAVPGFGGGTGRPGPAVHPPAPPSAGPPHRSARRDVPRSRLGSMRQPSDPSCRRSRCRGWRSRRTPSPRPRAGPRRGGERRWRADPDVAVRLTPDQHAVASRTLRRAALLHASTEQRPVLPSRCPLVPAVSPRSRSGA